MKRSRFTEEQVAYALRQAEGGTPVVGVCRQAGVSEATFAWGDSFQVVRSGQERPATGVQG